MEYVFLVATIAAAIHAYSFAQWLGNNGNKSGAIFVVFLIMFSLGLPVYRMLNMP